MLTSSKAARATEVVTVRHAQTSGGLRGRRIEQELLDRLVAEAWMGRGGALVVRGEGGRGKTSLRDGLQRRASGCRVVGVAGVDAGVDLEFAGRQGLCAGVLDRARRLPGAQREALDLAFG